MQHFLRGTEFSATDIRKIFDLTKTLKDERKRGFFRKPLEGKSIALIFMKPSTRTRISFQVGVAELGGTPIVLSSGDLQLGRGETIGDTANVLSRYLHGIMARVFAQSDLEQLAEHALVPVINGLSDLLHPCQTFADYFTIDERFGTTDVVLTYVGDGNNMAHSLLLTAALLGAKIRIATPKGYEPNSEIVREAQAIADKTLGEVVITTDVKAAARHADILYTDVWASMGQEAEHARRVKAFAGYQIDANLMKLAHPNCRLMHCLPAHRGEEVAADVVDGNQSIVFDQAENRLHVQKAIMMTLFIA